jgi:hypothetical protein
VSQLPNGNYGRTEEQSQERMMELARELEQLLHRNQVTTAAEYDHLVSTVRDRLFGTKRHISPRHGQTTDRLL